MAFFRLIPNLTIMAPKDFKELEEMLEVAIKLNKPVVIRYPRGEEGKFKFSKHEDIKEGKAEILKKGNNITIIAIGKAVSKAMEIAEDVKKDNIESEVINARFLKPLDKKTIKKSILKNKNVITIEDGTSINGLGTAIKELIVEEKIKDVEIKTYSYPDEYIKHGTVDQLEKIYHIDKESIEKKVRGHKYE